MTITHFTQGQCDVMNIADVPAIDPIQVCWINWRDGVGQVVITCFASAWTAYFNATGEKTIQEFFSMASADYLVDKLGFASTLKQRRADMAWLKRIVETVKAALTEEAVEVRHV